MSRQNIRSSIGVLAAALLAAIVSAGTVQAQSGQISGRVIAQDTGGPLASVQIYIEGTTRGALTNQGGTFSLPDVPPGNYTVIAQRIGYTQQTESGVTVEAGTNTSLELAMEPQVLALQGIVATGLVDPVEGVRSPITVGRLDREQMPIAVAGDALQSIQGRISGASVAKTSGRSPGGTNIQLRSLTSLEGNNSPLIVIDGVIVGYSTLSNIEPADVESVEVIKGAAAASLYGSRANAGIISIRTFRGTGVEMDRTEFSARSEYGYWTISRMHEFPTHHQFLVDDAANPTTYVDAAGNPVSRASRFAPAAHNAFMDKPYPGPIYDNVANAYKSGAFVVNNFMVSRNSLDTNFATALTRTIERGALVSNEGYRRLTFRTNLDHRFMDVFNMSASVSHLREDRDEVTGFSYNDLNRAPPDIDLLRRDEDGYVRIPDPEVAYINPLWQESNNLNNLYRMRTTANLTLRWEPTSWLSGHMLGGYDRSDLYSRHWTAKGTPLTLGGTEESDGSFSRYISMSDSWYTELHARLRRDFGPLNVRTSFRHLLENDEDQFWRAYGTGFVVGGVPSLAAIPSANTRGETTKSLGKAIGFIVDNSFAYGDKYIASILGRRDGSSAFGIDNRWHNYYRTAFAWRMAEEPWFNVPNVDEFKLSYARGTAGGRPGRTDALELWDITAAGTFTKSTLGNRDLQPEHTMEQEVMLSTILGGRFSIELAHAWQNTTNQIIPVAVPGFTGYSTQFRNGGTVEGYTTELTIEGQMITRPGFQWHAMVVADRSKGKITEWPYACTQPGFGTPRCAGVEMLSIWGNPLATDVSQLSTPGAECHQGCALSGRADEFMVNDEGYLVWVGQGNDFRDGIEKGLWGTSTSIDGVTYQWGVPFNVLDASGTPVYSQVGDASFVNVGWLNNLTFGNLTLHSQLHAKIGGQGINGVARGNTGSFRNPRQDQAGKPDELKKPVAYYSALSAGSMGAYYLEDTSFLKLRTLSAQYRLTPDQLARFGMSRMGMRTLSIGLIGRDLLTFTRYTGQDPELALSVVGGTQQENATYPTYASYTIEFGVTF
jgi:TonB-linked SusC/RagA family outer membrane protein